MYKEHAESEIVTNRGDGKYNIEQEQVVGSMRICVRERGRYECK